MFDWLKQPKNRVKAAAMLFFGSLGCMVVNVLLYTLRIVDSEGLILITLILSWLAITFTAADILASTDIRNNQG